MLPISFLTDKRGFLARRESCEAVMDKRPPPRYQAPAHTWARHTYYTYIQITLRNIIQSYTYLHTHTNTDWSQEKLGIELCIVCYCLVPIRR